MSEALCHSSSADSHVVAYIWGSDAVSNLYMPFSSLIVATNFPLESVILLPLGVNVTENPLFTILHTESKFSWRGHVKRL